MSKVCWILNVDLKGSSEVETTEVGRERLSRIQEDCFRFFASNEDLPPEFVAWGGDGGFALFDTDHYSSPEAAIKVARGFLKHIRDLVKIHCPDLDFALPPQYRVVVGRAVVAPSRRLSNYSGEMLNVILKFERDFGQPGCLSVLEEVYKQLPKLMKQGFSVREQPVHGIKIYDCPLSEGLVTAKEMEGWVLAAKDDIDATTIHWLMEDLKDRLVSRGTRKIKRTIREVLGQTFTPREFLDQLVKIIGDGLKQWSKEADFRVAYARINREKGDELRFECCTAKCHSMDEGLVIEMGSRTTAALAWADLKPKFVSSTARELKKPAHEREFDLLHANHKLQHSGSIACFPVMADSARESFLGVLCIDTLKEGFFTGNRVDALAVGLGPLIHELVLAELFSLLIQYGAVERPDPGTARTGSRRTKKSRRG